MNHRAVFALSCLLTACASSSPTGPTGPVMFPPPPDPPRILFLRSISACEDVQPVETSWLEKVVVGQQQNTSRPFGKPSTIVMRDGTFYLTDSELAALFRVDLKGKKADPVELQGRAQLMSPQGMCLDQDGNFYIADRARKQIVVLDKQFQWLREIGPWEDNSGPTDVAVWKDRLYVCDAGAACARVLDLATGKELLVLGKKQDRLEYMRGPVSLDVDGNGFVYVVDTVYSRIYVWDAEGKFVRHIGSPGDAAGHMARPKGVTVFENLVWILDSAFDNCQILDFDGRTLLFFGGQGGTPGTMSFPRKVWVGREGLDLFQAELDRTPEFKAEALIAVTNTWGAKISFYALGKSSKFTYEDVKLPERPSSQAPNPTSEAPAAEVPDKK